MKGRFFKLLWVAVTGGMAAALAMPVLAATPRAYVPLGSANQVAVIDLGNYHLVGDVSGVRNSHGSALTPNGRFLVAGSLTPHKAGSTSGKPEGVTPQEHAAHHHGGNTASSASPVLGTLYVIDTATDKVVRNFDVPGVIHHVLVTADGLYAVSTQPMSGAINVTSLKSGATVAHLATGPGPNYAVEDPQRHTIYVSNSGNGTISEVDTEHWYVRRNIRVGGRPEHMVLDRVNDRLYVNDVASGRALVVDSQSGKVLDQYPVGPAPHGIGLSRDRRTLYATSEQGDRLVAVRLKDGTIHSAELKPAPFHLAVNPADGRLLVTSQDAPKLWVIDQKTLAPIATIPLAGVGHQIALRRKTQE